MHGRRIELIGPKGLGDAIYLRAIVLHLLRDRPEITVFTSWPEVFADLPVATRLRAEAWPRDDETAIRYAISPNRLRHLGPCEGSEFATSCRQAGLTETADLILGWRVRDRGRRDEIRRQFRGRSICLYQPPKRPKNELQKLLSPNRKSFRRALKTLGAHHALIKIGHPEYVLGGADLPCDLDLTGPDTVSLIFDLSTVADFFFGEACCFVPVLAQAAGKPFACMFSRRALASDDPFAGGTTPRWIIHKPELATVLFDDG